jgi:dihydroflavonol-4-reductase
MKALITGGAGFLGVKLAAALLERGHTVRLLTRGKRPDVVGAEVVHGDLSDKEALRQACSGCDVVFHTAGVISYNPQKNDIMFQTNVIGTRNAVEAALHAGVKKFIHTSSTAAIGINEDPNTLLNEDSPFNAASTGLAYFTTKHAAEKEVLEGVKQGLHAVILCPGSLMGPGDTRRYEQTYPGLIYKYNPRFLIHGGINFVDIDDVVKGHLLALEKGRKGERYILGGENLTYAELITRTNKLIGREPPKFYIPKWLMGVAALAIKLVTMMGAKLHITPEIVRQTARWYLFVDSSKAQRELGYQPRFIDNSIAQTISWLKSIGRL